MADLTDDTVFSLCCLAVEFRHLNSYCTQSFGGVKILRLTWTLSPNIDEQADFNAGRLEIVDELGLVYGVEVFDGFEFKDDLVFHDDVGHVVADQLVVVIDLDLLFLFGAESGFQELDQEGILIDDFKEAEANGVVDLVGALDDVGCEVLVFHSFGTDGTDGTDNSFLLP